MRSWCDQNNVNNGAAPNDELNWIALIVLILCFILLAILFAREYLDIDFATMFRQILKPSLSNNMKGGCDHTGTTKMSHEERFKKAVKIITSEFNQNTAEGRRNAAEFERLFMKVHDASSVDGPQLPPVVTIDDIKESIVYTDLRKAPTSATHIGQRKLFLTELQFLTDIMMLNVMDDTKKMTVVYAGAAPSNHTGYLSDLFPHIKFVLIDPNPFKVHEATPRVLLEKGKSGVATDHSSQSTGVFNQEICQKMLEEVVRDDKNRIFIINDLMTMELAHATRQVIPEHYFISDIRTNSTSGTERDIPDALDILWNCAQQLNWMTVMKPRLSMLKFRHPFYNENPEVFKRKSRESPYMEDFAEAKKNGIDFVANFESKKLVYWDGTVNLQAWPGSHSTETRLITEAKSFKDWGTPVAFENKLFYYNYIERWVGLHKNDNADGPLGFDHCNDCALENHLWVRYLHMLYRGKWDGQSGDKRDTDKKDAKKEKSQVLALVAKLSKITYRPLRREHHGLLFESLTADRLEYLIRNTGKSH